MFHAKTQRLARLCVKLLDLSNRSGVVNMHYHNHIARAFRALMMKYLFLVILFGYFLWSVPAVNADFCVQPGVEGGIAVASAVFSGKIVEIRRLDDSSRRHPADGFEYLVKFAVDEVWKGPNAAELSVVWQTKLHACSDYFPVGEIGERYLVYADLPKGEAGKNNLPEVNFLNRTSRLPLTDAPVKFDLEDLEKQSRTLTEAPQLNRADASQDVVMLRRMKACECSSTGTDQSMSCLNSWGHLREVTAQDDSASACCKCLRRYYRYSLN